MQRSALRSSFEAQFIGNASQYKVACTECPGGCVVITLGDLCACLVHCMTYPSHFLMVYHAFVIVCMALLESVSCQVDA